MERIIKSHFSAGRVAWSDVIEPSPCCMCIRFSSYSFSLPTELMRIRCQSNYTEPSGNVVNRENLRRRTSYVSEKQSPNRVSLTTVYHVYDGWREKQASTEYRILHCSIRDHWTQPNGVRNWNDKYFEKPLSAQIAQSYF